MTPPHFLSDAALAAAFEDIHARFQVVEHYLVAEPPGLLMLSATGKLLRWIVLSERDADEWVQFARRNGAPSDLVRALVERRCLAYVYDDVDMLHDDPADWSEYLHPAHIVRSDGQTWITSLITDPPMDIDFDPARSSLQAYLDRVDRALMA